MIVSSLFLRLSLFGVSLGVHLALLLFWFAAPRVETAGGSGAVVEAQLGNSFADFVAGAKQAVPPLQTPVEPPRQLAEPTRQDPTDILIAKPVATPPADSPSVVEAEHAQSAQVTVPQAVDPHLATAPTLRAEPVPQVAPDDRIDAQETPRVAAVSPQAPRTTGAQRVDPAETIQPDPPTPETISAATDISPQRPKVRPDPVPQTEPARRAQTAPQGNSTQNSARGSVSGAHTATATQQSSAVSSTSQAGNAAVSNYPGKVMRKISRQRKPRAQGGGTAVIQFAVAGSGALQSATLVQSSGSQRFDRAALEMIRRAAPFPTPPAGARRRFTIRIDGRG